MSFKALMMHDARHTMHARQRSQLLTSTSCSGELKMFLTYQQGSSKRAEFALQISNSFLSGKAPFEKGLVFKQTTGIEKVASLVNMGENLIDVSILLKWTVLKIDLEKVYIFTCNGKTVPDP